MRFSTLVISIAGLTATGSAFVIDTFSDNNCGNYLQNVNIGDNNCAKWQKRFSSFKITAWGGSRQDAFFDVGYDCYPFPAHTLRHGRVDSASPDFRLGECYNFGGYTAGAVMSE